MTRLLGRALLVAVVLAVVVSFLVRAVQGKLATLDFSSIVTACIALVPILISAARSSPAAPSADDKAQLADVVRDQWRVEARNRRLFEGRTIPVRWRVLPASDARSPLVQRLRDRGEVQGLLDGYARSLRAGEPARLVVTGEMGAGKTACCVLLISELGRLGDEDAPVPVLFQLGSWDPATSLADWLAAELLASYPLVGDLTAAAELVARDVLPLLDGLDENADPAAALRRLEDELPGRSYVLTCRTEEFATANRQGVLGDSLVIALQPLEAKEVRTYLTDHSAGSTRLAAFTDRLRRDPDGPLAQALRTPFMASLAADSRFVADADLTAAGADEVRGQLLDTFLDKAYAPGDPAVAERYLSFLAAHTDPGTRRLAWWHLYRAVPRALYVGASVFNAAVACSTLAALFFGLFQRPWLGFWIGLSAGVVGALVVEALPQDDPHRAVPRVRWPHAAGRRALLRVLGFGAMGAAACAAMVIALYGPVRYVVIGAVLSGTTFALARLVSEPVDPMRAVTPDRLLRADRSTVIYAAVTGAVAGAITGGYLGGSFHAGHRAGLHGLWILSLPAPVEALLGAVGGAALSALGLGLMATGVSSWGRFFTARCWLALRGHTPLRLVRFLDDAYRRGVLREVNGYYEFRHGLLHDRLLRRR